MKTSTLLLLSPIGIAFAATDVALGADIESDHVLRWASAGGGFRNLVTNVGYANVFAQAGLFGDGESSSKFSALSGQSGGSWFASLFFYSLPFYTNTIHSTPQELSELVQRAMGLYRRYSDTYYKEDEICASFESLRETTGISELDSLVAYCGLLATHGGSWAGLNDEVMDVIATDFGVNDLVSLPMNRENRIAPLLSTDMYLQMTMLPNSLIRNPNKRGRDTVSYLGLEGENSMYTVPLDVQWSVSDNYAAFVSNTPNGTAFPSKMVAYKDSTPREFSAADWEIFFLYSNRENGVTKVAIPRTASLAGSVRVPFGGMPPTISQITAASTSVPGFIASSVPSTVAQVLSTYPDDPEDLAIAAVKNIVSQSFEKFDELAVCSQWPMAQCDERDVRLADGYAADAPTAALNIGQYQTMQNGDLSKTIKLILTPPNSYGVNNPPIYLMSNFETTFNQGIEPGDFYWPSERLLVPMSSPQIFADYLDLAKYEAMLEPVMDIQDGSVLRTARIQTTTIDNPTFLVKGGQKVDILLLQLASDIPMEIMGVVAIDRWTGPLANLAEDIAASAELVRRVQDFISSS